MLFSEVRVAHKKTTMMKLGLALAAVAALGLAQGNQPKAPVAKDAQEANLVNSAAKEADPAKRLTELDQWTQKYPDTQLTEQRDLLYWVTYQQLKKGREAIDWAKKVLERKPDSYMALMTIMQFGPTMNNNKPAQPDFDATMAAANTMLNDADKVFADSNRPVTVAADAWPKVKPYWEKQAPHVMAQLWVNQGDNAKAEDEIKKMTEKWPNDALLDQMLGQVILAEKVAQKQPLALFYYARAACYDGDGSLPAQTRNSLKSGFLTRAYATYHGSNDGLEQLCQTAKANPAPPADFKVMSTVDIAQAKQQAEEAAEKADPAGAIWKTVKTGLTGDNPDQFFQGSVKDAGLPGKDPNDQTKDLKWKGKIVSMKPTIRPKELVLAVENPAGDVTLTFETPLPGKMEPGSEIEFSGAVKAYNKDPYMLTMESEKDMISGWKPVPTPVHRPVGKKKAQ